ncbi:DNA-formamidopyrimidine glycosylase family protein [Dietzia sp. 111N12-1]|uniref:DNA-formamidopyrimidine glycosylase family protein n=1 Tax=Dietzia sp. 111N12-1 TaxID=1785156 RepID=UPI0002D4DA92|nr:DNA-formamidopyrimidine glycosylase family protein [Dietzia sp. 111N12-1]MDZ4233495.1 DNA-formamidopyrimidine glycosylase family protein [Dietzia sp.]OAV77554.1 DNA glycosylase [Dietzia sp. 111N12-1]
MPEGDTVHRAAARVRAALAGRTMDRTELRVPRFAAVDLRGRTVEAARSRGKHLLVVVGPDGQGRDPVTLHIHLKMEGRIHVLRAGERWRFPAHTVRLVLRAGDTEVVGTELGLLRALTPAEADGAVEHLGPDLLDADWDPVASTAEAVRRIRERPGRTIGEALLDQRNLAGIGTIYRAELCFLRGVDPRDPVEVGPDLGATVTLARKMLVANANRVVRVTTGETRRGRELWVYGRDGRPCRRCGTRVETFRLGGLADPHEPSDSPDRIAYRCPSCQPRRATLSASPTEENS